MDEKRPQFTPPAVMTWDRLTPIERMRFALEMEDPSQKQQPKIITKRFVP